MQLSLAKLMQKNPKPKQSTVPIFEILNSSAMTTDEDKLRTYDL